MAFPRMFVAAVFALAMGTPHQAGAEPVRIHTDYTVSLIGFPVASARFVTQLEGKSYRISGDLRSSALSDIFSKIRGEASVSGKVAGTRLEASKFLASYTSGTRKQRIEIGFRSGDVVSTVNEPESRRRTADWEPLRKTDLRSVLDPLSSLVFPAGEAACPRSLPVYDGQSRITLHLTPIGVRPFRTTGFQGDATACAVRFEPNSGFRKNSSSIAYLRNLKGMEVWFGKDERTDLFAPVYAKVPTKIGQVIVAATRFGG